MFKLSSLMTPANATPVQIAAAPVAPAKPARAVRSAPAEAPPAKPARAVRAAPAEAPKRGRKSKGQETVPYSIRMPKELRNFVFEHAHQRSMASKEQVSAADIVVQAVEEFRARQAG